ncbi:AzlD family protein [Flaviflagellibacter deserti]|uniref:AzlD family protein n=1 Tax=Flaviflagellibacter deserti TaxID=2267266 RepID=A0ABV9Z5X1_9HYPH
MTVTLANLLAILAMAAATYATRVSGLFIADRIPKSGRARAALDALPAAVLTAVIAPTAVATGPAETIAAGITVLAAFRLPLLATVVVGVVAVVVLRLLLGS